IDLDAVRGGVVAAGLDDGIGDEPARAQRARRLVEQTRDEGVALREQQHVFDDFLAREDVYAVRPAIQRLVLVGVAGVEDVVDGDVDRADRRARFFERGARRAGVLRLAWLLRRRDV